MLVRFDFKPSRLKLLLACTTLLSFALYLLESLGCEDDCVVRGLRPISSEKLPLHSHVQQHCAHLRRDYDKLLEPLFEHWQNSGFDRDMLEHTSGDRVYVYQGRVHLSNSTSWARTIPTFVRYIQHIASLVHLPDMMLPLNPADEPLAAVRPNATPTPLLAFCKVPGYSDILIPNTAEGNCRRLLDDRLRCCNCSFSARLQGTLMLKYLTKGKARCLCRVRRTRANLRLFGEVRQAGLED